MAKPGGIMCGSAFAGFCTQARHKQHNSRGILLCKRDVERSFETSVKDVESMHLQNSPLAVTFFSVSTKALMFKSIIDNFKPFNATSDKVIMLTVWKVLVLRCRSEMELHLCTPYGSVRLFHL